MSKETTELLNKKIFYRKPKKKIRKQKNKEIKIKKKKSKKNQNWIVSDPLINYICYN